MHFVAPTWLNSLRLKILLAYIIGVVLSISLIILVIVWLIKYQSGYLAEVDVSGFTQDMSKELRFDDAGNPIGFDGIEADLNWVFDSLQKEAAYRVMNEDFETVLVSPAGRIFWPKKHLGTYYQEGHFEFIINENLIHGSTAIIERGGKTWYLQFGVSSRFFHLMHEGFALPFAGIGIVIFSLVLLFVFGACTFITLKYTLKPLQQVSDSAASISPRSIHARLPTKNIPSEIAPTVASFNSVLERLEKGYRIQQDFLATAAHELKTPLALIRAQIELNENSKDRNILLNDVEHMARQVQQLLILAEVSEERNYELTDINLKEASMDVITYLDPMASSRNVRITLEHKSPVFWRADRAALFVLLKNLLENAIQHAPSGTQVKVKIEDSITIQDWGPGIEPENIPHIFKRFWRGAHRRDHGAGLGLAICKEISTAHGWTLELRQLEPGVLFCLDNPHS